jgi:hypothetical protein
LNLTAAIFPDRDALIDISAGSRWSYRRFLAEIDALALGPATLLLGLRGEHPNASEPIRVHRPRLGKGDGRPADTHGRGGPSHILAVRYFRPAAAGR